MSRRGDETTPATMRGAGAIPAAPVSSLHEMVWKLINDAIDARFADFGITAATVTGTDAAGVQVLLDTEDDPRTIGLPRGLGQQYAKGGRVLVGTLVSGDKVVLGNAASGNGAPVVGAPDILPDAIGRDHIQNGAINSEHMNTGSVSSGAIQNGAVTPDKTTFKGSLANADSAVQKGDFKQGGKYGFGNLLYLGDLKLSPDQLAYLGDLWANRINIPSSSLTVNDALKQLWKKTFGGSMP